MKTWLSFKSKKGRYFYKKEKQLKTNGINYQTIAIPENSIDSGGIIGDSRFVVSFKRKRNLNTYTFNIKQGRLDCTAIVKNTKKILTGSFILKELIILKIKNKKIRIFFDYLGYLFFESLSIKNYLSIPVLIQLE